jgi:hypothetical protein
MFAQLEEKIHTLEITKSEAVVEALNLWLKSKEVPVIQATRTPIPVPSYKPGHDITIGEFAALYWSNFRRGRNQMFSLLREMSIIHQYDTLPLTKYIEKGYFRVVMSENNGNFFTQAVLTRKGQKWLPETIQKYLAVYQEG